MELCGFFVQSESYLCETGIPVNVKDFENSERSFLKTKVTTFPLQRNRNKINCGQKSDCQKMGMHHIFNRKTMGIKSRCIHVKKSRYI